MASDRVSNHSPFAAEVSLADDAGELEITLEVQAQAVSAPMRVVERIADAFVTAASAGMFSRNPGAARTRPIEVLSVDGPVHGTIRYVLRARDIQPGAYRVLLNMLATCHYSSVPLEAVRLTSKSRGGRHMNASTVVTLDYPNTAATVPFELTLPEELYDFKQPTVRLEFEREVTDEELERLVPLFIAWDHLIVLGGYLETVDEEAEAVDDSLWSQETHLAAPDTVEHAFYGIVEEEAAFDALMNMAVTLHRTMSPVMAFEIE